MPKLLSAICKLLLAIVFFISIKATAQPTITGITPVGGPAGTSVTITGTNFNATPANNIVFFGAAAATVVSGTTTSLTVTAPVTATYQHLSVFDNATGLTAFSNDLFSTIFINPFGTGMPANFFKPKIDFTSGLGPNSVVTGDINADGKLDMITANNGSNSLSVLLNTTSAPGISPTFSAKVDFTTGTGPTGVAIGDLNGDGKPDMVSTNSGVSTVSVFINTTAPGAPVPTFSAKFDFSTGIAPVAVSIADINGDGIPDIVVANSGAASVSILRNTTVPGSGTPSFAAKTDFSTGISPISVVTGNINGDSHIDIVVANAGSSTVSVLLNTTPAGGSVLTFSPKTDFSTGANPGSVALGDINADGKPDIIAANSGAASVSVLFNTTANGGATPAFASKVDFTCGTNPSSAAIGDLDGDGMPDIAIGNSGVASVSILRNTTAPASGTPSFTAKVDFTTGTNPNSVMIADMDGDSIPEIAAANFTSGSISLFQINLAALPVTITNIKAYQKNNGVQIEWTSQQEMNIDRYEVERSQNGLQFTRVGTVQSTGNSSLIKNYSFFDPVSFTGALYYRIKIIEAGQTTYTKTIRLFFTSDAANLMSVFPNPIQGNSIAVRINLPKGTYSLNLTNKLGQNMATRTIYHPGGEATENILLPKALATGIYQLKLSGEGINITRQLISN